MSTDIASRCRGARWVDDPGKGSGDTLKFVNVPDSLSGAFLEEISGLDGKHEHPLEGAVYFTENLGGDTFNLTIFQNGAEKMIKAFAGWCMCFTFIDYADDETKIKISAAQVA
jgi:hypothetical protein